ncbi:Transcriptional repressor NF-X1 [Araneus ventricosus]|uniref:Transcriptional repressor NF-X1 n=1 Tax=Araneus ventricosus TaxID=182803 RepID=A0A4Y2GPF6_ARAVE|nr:Transcriptional repressor NF-X1 [Araneus ventricosus]
MEPRYQRQDRQRGDHRPRYFRNSRRGAYSNRQHRNYHSDQDGSGSYVAEASNAAPGNSCDFDSTNGAYSSETNCNLATDYSQPSKSRNNSNQSYSSEKLSRENQNNNDHGTSKKTYENSKLNVNAPSFTSIYNHPNPENETSISRRGAIVGGRYIRKHANYSVEQNPQTNNSSNYENTSYEQNANYSSHSSAHKSRNSPNNQRYQSRPFADSDARRQFPSKSSKSSDYSSRSSQASGQRSNEENFDMRRQFSSKNSDYSSRSSNGQRSNEEDTRRQFSSKPSRTNDYFLRSSQASGQRLDENDSDLRRQYSSKPSRNIDYSRSSQASGQRLNEDDFDARRQFPLKLSKNSDYSSRSSQSGGQRLNENTSASTDVYRFSSSNVNEKRTYKSNRANSHSYEIDANQRELLIQQLNKGDYECLVCCDRIRVKDQIWHCLNCYHVFHLRCIRKWARSPAASVPDEGWRCPACQNLTSKVPFDYFCFCGAHKNPDVNYHLTPHTCGEICGRNPPDCSHPCKELCHPGPCPPCSVVVQKSCACGKTVKALPCKQDVELTCSSVCEKPLNCGMHLCTIQCHPGECPLCEEEIHQECYCKKSKKTVICDSDTSGVLHFSCGEVCGRLLSCGNHSCDNICHPGDCSPCGLSTEIVKYCPCGKTGIQELIANGKAVQRKSCKDPIPLCSKICGKVFFCGPKDDPHKCQSACHEGDCPKCPLTTSLKCRCGASTKEFHCAEIEPSFVFLCEKRCNRRKACGRHKCLNNCCINIEHRCELICNKKLSCGNHQCQDTCHAGNCPPCGNVSFDELRCHCGESVLYPPIHCGTSPLDALNHVS